MKPYFWKQLRSLLPVSIRKSASKVFYNIDLAEQTNDTKIFKKLQGEIWEFRSTYLGNQNRLLAFWDKSNNGNTFVIATNGFIKKTNKVPKNEIQKAENIRSEYFSSKK